MPVRPFTAKELEYLRMMHNPSAHKNYQPEAVAISYYASFLLYKGQCLTTESMNFDYKPAIHRYYEIIGRIPSDFLMTIHVSKPSGEILINNHEELGFLKAADAGYYRSMQLSRGVEHIGGIIHSATIPWIAEKEFDPHQEPLGMQKKPSNYIFEDAKSGSEIVEVIQRESSIFNFGKILEGLMHIRRQKIEVEEDAKNYIWSFLLGLKATKSNIEIICRLAIHFSDQFKKLDVAAFQKRLHVVTYPNAKLLSFKPRYSLPRVHGMLQHKQCHDYKESLSTFLKVSGPPKLSSTQKVAFDALVDPLLRNSIISRPIEKTGLIEEADAAAHKMSVIEFKTLLPDSVKFMKKLKKQIKLMEKNVKKFKLSLEAELLRSESNSSFLKSRGFSKLFKAPSLQALINAYVRRNALAYSQILPRMNLQDIVAVDDAVHWLLEAKVNLSSLKRAEKAVKDEDAHKLIDEFVKQDIPSDYVHLIIVMEYHLGYRIRPKNIQILL